MEDWSPANDALSSKDLELNPWCQKLQNSKLKTARSNEKNSKQNLWGGSEVIQYIH